MYEQLPAFVLGFHGCDAALAERVFAGKAELRESQNDYDWLGHGIYFWENNAARALDYARLLSRHPRRGRQSVRTPGVIGAVIDMGRCLNLLDSQAIRIVRTAYHQLRRVTSSAGLPLPQNRTLRRSDDLLLRRLDCAVIEYVHQTREARRQPGYDSVRGVLVEGNPLYPNAGFYARSHIQICVRSLDCIKGYFRPRSA